MQLPMHRFRSRVTPISQCPLDRRSICLYLLSLNIDTVAKAETPVVADVEKLDEPRHDVQATTSQTPASFLGIFPNAKHAVQGPRRSEQDFVKARRLPATQDCEHAPEE